MSANRKVQEWVQVLTTHGVRMTPQRRAILCFLAQTRSHPTAAEVYRAVRARFPHVSRATVYNTLNLMSRMGLIAELRREDRAVRYETHLEPHINLICLSCGRVFDWEATVSLPPNPPEGFQILYGHVDIYGYCPDCLRKKEGKA